MLIIFSFEISNEYGAEPVNKKKISNEKNEDSQNNIRIPFQEQKNLRNNDYEFLQLK